MRKYKGNAEVAVMEVSPVGVRTRARALAMAAASSGTTPRRRRRKVGNVGGSGELRFASSYVQLRSSRRRVLNTPENSVSPAEKNHRRISPVDRCSSPSSDYVTTSCCSSNGSSRRIKKRMKFVDPEDVEVEKSTYLDCRERERETTPMSELRVDQSGELEYSTATPLSEETSRVRFTAEKISLPSESEIEEFFAAAEKDLKQRFTEKYNYDVIKDIPLEGRYEWVQLKP